MTAEPVSSLNPYIGPRTFSREHGNLYFGREQEARDLLARVVSERLLLFYAQSGAGKSSLINTRLIPTLQTEGFAVLPVGRVSGELPPDVGQVENIYLFNLMASLDQSDGDPQRFARLSLSDFLARLVTDDGEHWEYDETAQSVAQPTSGATPTSNDSLTSSQHFVLIVDQFEEIVTTHPERWPERGGFFRQLDRAMADDPNLWVVLTLREDYVAALDPYASLLTDRLRARFYMERMGVPSALEAVKRPTASFGRPFAAGVAEKLVDDLRRVRIVGQEDPALGPNVEPVQLQVVCFQLWERLRRAEDGRRQTTDGDQSAEGRFITEVDLAEAGDANQALEQFYADTLASVLAEPAVQAAGVTERALREWFDKELITEIGIRNTVFRNETVGRTGSLFNVAVNELARRYLLRTELRAGGAWVELVHDRLVEPIRTNNAAWFPLHLSTLQRQAALWDEEDRPSGLLLQNQALAEAEAWATVHVDELEPHERDFLEACRQARAMVERERRQSRRIRVLAAVAAGVAALAILAAIAAGALRLQAQEQTRLAEDRTELAKLLLAVQGDFLVQLENRRLTVAMLNQQRQRLSQGQIVLASGVVPPRAKVPDLIGTNYADAQQLLDRACEPQPCLRTQVVWETNDLQGSGLVLRSEPFANTELLWGAPVTLTLSQGAPMTIQEPVAMELVPIPTGAFLMGSDIWADASANPDELPQHAVNLPEFYVGKHEITKAQYAAFVKATGHDAPSDWENASVPPNQEDHPVANVSWNDAVAFAKWLGEETGMAFRLCTEAEWEKACRGTSGLIYPWGDTADAEKANISESGIGTTTPVGKYSPDGDSPYGAADMAGNLFEWVADWYSEDYYARSPVQNPQGPGSGDYHVLRGGSLYYHKVGARCAYRSQDYADFPNPPYGLRVCVSPVPEK